MDYKDLNLKKVIKISPKGGNKKLRNLLKEIEKMKKQLDGKVSEENKMLTSTEVIELSQKLDKLVVEYMKSM